MENKKKVALIFGVTGQDGSYMAELLSEKGYDIIGVVRKGYDPVKVDFISSLVKKISYFEIDITNRDSVRYMIEHTTPDEIYNFAGVSDVFRPYESINTTIILNFLVPSYILESIVDTTTKFFQASSCLIFGVGKDTKGISQDEKTEISPIYPYGVAKAAADMLIKEYRRKSGVFAVSGIFFPHESPRRGENFFTRKISKMIAKISLGVDVTRMIIGNTFRDWGYAKEYMEASYLMMQNKEPKDYVIGTGLVYSQHELCKNAFEYAGLDVDKYIKLESRELSSLRQDDVNGLVANRRRIEWDLGWIPKTDIHKVMQLMIDEDIKLLKEEYDDRTI